MQYSMSMCQCVLKHTIHGSAHGHGTALQSTYHLLHFPLRPEVALIPVEGIKLKKIKI